MRRAMTIMTAVVALAVGGTTLAAQATKAPAAASKAAKAAATSGKITRFDAATNTLTITTTKGDETFTLASNSTLRQGSKTIAPSDLTSLMGQNAKVRYSEAGGRKTAESVMVSGAKTAAKAPKTKKR